ncbi:hypothetical protein ACHAXS_004032 [Conticribra weissflogii]
MRTFQANEKRPLLNKKQKAIQLFRQKQYKQHHHIIRASTTGTSSTGLDTETGPSSITAAYLHSLHRFSSHVNDYGTIHSTSTHGHNKGKKYLDSLHLEKYPKSIWRNYNDKYLNKKSVLVNKASNDGKDEVNGEFLTYSFFFIALKQELSTLRDLLQLEQTMNQTLAMDAQIQELGCLHGINDCCNNNDNGNGDDIEEELSAFDESAKQF